MKKINFLISVMVVIMMLASVAVQASGSLTVTTDVFTGIITVSTTFGTCPNEPVSLEIIPADVTKEELIVSSDALQTSLGKITYFKQTNADSYGHASFTFPLKNSGEYLVRTHAMSNIGDAVEQVVDYVTPSDASEVWDNLVSNPSENLPVLLKILDVRDALVLSMASDENLIHEIEGYSSIGSFTKENVNSLIAKIKSDCEDITFLRNVLAEIDNAGNTTLINSIVTNSEKAEILGLTSDIMTRYYTLKNTKIADNAVVGKTYLTPEEFRADFIDGIVLAEKAQSENQPNTTPPKIPSSGGVGGGSLGSSASVPSVMPPVSQDTHSFTDISDVSWAEEAIVALYNEGIISGKSKHEFAPNDNITREEFVKIALGVMGIEPNPGIVAFSDVDASSWYAPYVNAALSAGIVSGYSDTQFGVGEYITRQDVAVILNRIHNFSNVNVSTPFSDSNDISDYAKSAVEKLSGAGIINGSESKFMPKSNCTRAEAACMVYRMMSLMKEGK